ncbi:MAG: septum site-determining protein MinC, partial [Zoogloeaceae bacterium]|nr:septum site-determining protein MinC [Zoogloeaceae bacterium]
MKKPPFVCKGSTVSVLMVRLQTLSLPVILAAAEKNYGNRDFFGGKACLLDVSEIPPDAQQAALTQTDWKALIAGFAGCGLKIAGILGATPELTREAEANGLTAFAQEMKHVKAKLEVSEIAPEEKQQEEEESIQATAELPGMEKAKAPVESTVAPTNETTPAEPTATPVARDVLFLDRPLRSGQVVYARNSDLVVTSFVSPGAELIADGNIYSFAPMRGRIHAGASGDVNARIYSTH